MPEMTADDLGAWLWVLWADSGHEDCGGWTFQDDRLTCECGADLFEAAPVTGVQP